MKRIIIYIIVLTLSMIVPEYGTDVGKLIPVEVVLLHKEENRIRIETDAGVWGSGETVNEAIHELHKSAPGEVFLDTAEYLLIEESAKEHINEMGEYLKGSVRVCMAEQGLDLQEAAQYMDEHPPKMKLKIAEIYEIEEKLEQIEGKLKIS